MTNQDQNPPKILIVDDEAQIRSMLIRSLADGTCECIPSSNAFDALNKIHSDRFSLVMSDICMPGMSGIDLLRLIKKHDPDISVIMISGVMDLTTAVDSLKMGACDYLTKPFDLLSVRRAVRRALERRRLIMENRCYQQELERLVQERTFELKGALKEVEESYRYTLEALAAALDAREHETQAHSQRVREYAVTLAQSLGLGAQELIDIGHGALLHDVGKIGVPDSILLKPGKLTSEEWIQMRRHPRVGYEILGGIKFLAPAADIVLTHQERWDGRGYPNGLAGPEIPLGARIFGVVDTLDAMTSDRPYRKALSFQAARAEVQHCSGTQFDPEVAEAFLSLAPETWQNIHDRINGCKITEDPCAALCLK
jgi:response regulator RpfG family c-di-GMP phosphodiesterase